MTGASPTSDPPPLRCPACGAPLAMDTRQPGQTTVVCGYCGTATPVARAWWPRVTLWLTDDGRWIQGGWAGDPRVWGVFVLLILGLVTLLVFGNFGPR